MKRGVLQKKLSRTKNSVFWSISEKTSAGVLHITAVFDPMTPFHLYPWSRVVLFRHRAAADELWVPVPKVTIDSRKDFACPPQAKIFCRIHVHHMVFYAFLGTLIPLNFSLLHLFNALSYLLILNPLNPNPPKFSLIRLIPLKISLIR